MSYAELKRKSAWFSEKAYEDNSTAKLEIAPAIRYPDEHFERQIDKHRQLPARHGIHVARFEASPASFTERWDVANAC